MRLLLVALALPLAQAAIFRRRSDAACPKPVEITMKPGGTSVTVTGTSTGGVDNFFGIPFAAPATGALRFKAPQPKDWSGTSVFNATTPGPACLQAPSTIVGNYGVSDDCLTLNIIAPKGVAGSDAKLPVMFWIYGGGFVMGTGNTFLDPNFVDYGKKTDRPFVLVTFNYRLGPLGVGYGKEYEAAGAANLALKDQVAAMQWVRDNIASFGGDPAKVTIFGQSAGAMSVSVHLLNKTQDLFRGAIMQSGGPSTQGMGRTAQYNQWYADAFARLVGCGGNRTLASGEDGQSCNVPDYAPLSGSAGKSDAAGKVPNPLDCIANVSNEAIVKAILVLQNQRPASIPFFWGPNIDGDVIPESPQDMLAKGDFARIPFISGNVRDEGTMFVSPAVTPTTFGGGAGYLLNWFMGADRLQPDIIAKIEAMYPRDPVQGSPFGTGNETFGLDPSWKQGCASLGDAAFQSRRRYWLRQYGNHGFAQSWSYLFEGPGPRGSPPSQGIQHSQELPYMFGLATREDYSQQSVDLSEKMMDYWINFAYYLDPNGQPGGAKSKLPHWDSYGFPGAKNSMQFSPGNTTLIQDDYRAKEMALFDEPDIVAAFHY